MGQLHWKIEVNVRQFTHGENDAKNVLQSSQNQDEVECLLRSNREIIYNIFVTFTLTKWEQFHIENEGEWVAVDST